MLHPQQVRLGCFQVLIALIQQVQPLDEDSIAMATVAPMWFFFENGVCVCVFSGWWFQTWILFSISYIGCHPSHWRTHIFQDGYCTTNQFPFFWFHQEVQLMIIGSPPRSFTPQVLVAYQASPRILGPECEHYRDDWICTRKHDW